jgi:hypothetical protein
MRKNKGGGREEKWKMKDDMAGGGERRGEVGRKQKMTKGGKRRTNQRVWGRKNRKEEVLSMCNRDHWEGGDENRVKGERRRRNAVK